jgi:hypothetical protein
VDSYHELGARTADFEVSDREPGLRCLEWVHEELQALPTIVEGFMSYASLVSHPFPKGRAGCIAYVCQDLFPHIC